VEKIEAPYLLQPRVDLTMSPEYPDLTVHR
jgi:hypothetical protein